MGFKACGCDRSGFSTKFVFGGASLWMCRAKIYDSSRALSAASSCRTKPRGAMRHLSNIGAEGSTGVNALVIITGLPVSARPS